MDIGVRVRVLVGACRARRRGAISTAAVSSRGVEVPPSLCGNLLPQGGGGGVISTVRVSAVIRAVREADKNVFAFRSTRTAMILT